MPDQTMRERVTDQTPSTEDVRWKYRCMRVMDGAKDIAAQTEFNAWLAAHDRAVKAEAKAEALREVAAILRQQPSTPGERGLAAWLDTRADRIEAGA